MKDIYAQQLNLDIANLPDDLKLDGVEVTPSSKYKLTITVDGVTKTIIWDKGFWYVSDSMPADNNLFLLFTQYVRNYIYSTDEYKAMPDARGGYL